MFERFTEPARQVVVLAQEEAQALKHDYIGTEHLLLGLVRAGDGIAAHVLTSLDITVERVRAQIVLIVGSGDDISPTKIPFTPRSKQVLEQALQEALRLNHNYIGTEHILLGLTSEREGVGARILLDFGVDFDRVHDEVLRRLPVRTRASLSGMMRDAPAPVVTSLTRRPRSGAQTFHVVPDGDALRILRAAAARALQDDREEYTVADLIAAIRADAESESPGTLPLDDQPA
jgi:ATP-dependent Clp protease ATP-binding subunit ClpA